MWESGCDRPKPRRPVDEDQLGYQMILKGTDMSLMTAEEKEKSFVFCFLFFYQSLQVLTCHARLNVS